MVNHFSSIFAKLNLEKKLIIEDPIVKKTISAVLCWLTSGLIKKDKSKTQNKIISNYLI